MLYDPKWEVKTDPFSLESLIAWLEKQPADGTYSTLPVDMCLLGQFASAMGAESALCKSYELGNETVFMDVAFPYNPAELTFGAALKRARALTAHD